MTACLLDAGPLAALFDPEDRFHEHFRDQILGKRPSLLYTTWPCVTEASHLVEPRFRLAMLGWIGNGAVHVYPFSGADLPEMCEWMQRYTQQPRTEMDFADASLYWLACQSGVNRIWTMDVRDFQRYRLPDGQSFEIL